MSNFEKLMDLLKENGYKKSVSFGEWDFLGEDDGICNLFFKKKQVLSVYEGKVIDVSWGYNFSEESGKSVLCFDILKAILNIPGVSLDVLTVENTDGLAALGYSDPVHFPEIDDFSNYERHYYACRPVEDGKSDYVIFFDSGNTWCNVIAAFEKIDEERFLREAKSCFEKIEMDKYTETECRKCPMCGSVNELKLTQDEAFNLLMYSFGDLNIQDALPGLTPFEREFLKTGYCPKCQEILFGKKFERRAGRWVLFKDSKTPDVGEK